MVRRRQVTGVLLVLMLMTSIVVPSKSMASEATGGAKLTLKDTSTAGELQLEMSQEPTATANDTGLVFAKDHEAAGADVFYMKNTTAYEKVTSGDAVKSVFPVGEKSGMWLDGKRLESDQFDFATAGWSGEFFTRLSQTCTITLQKGNRLTLKGTFATADGSYRFEMKELTIEYLGAVDTYRWSVVEKPDIQLPAEAENLAVTPTWVEESNTLYVNCTGLHAMTGMKAGSYASFSSVGTDSGIYLDGEKVTDANFFDAGWKDAFIIRVNGSVSYEIGVTKIRIQGIWKYNDYYFSVKPQQFVYTRETGVDRWTVDTTYEPEITEESWSSFKGNILKDGKVLQNADGTAVGLLISDTTPVSAKITLPAEAQKNDVITISGDFQTATHTVSLEEVSYRWNGSSWKIYLSTDIEAKNVEWGTKSKEIYLRVSEQLKGPAWTKSLNAVQGKGIILYNGASITVPIQVGYDLNMICINLSAKTPVRGDTLLISGALDYSGEEEGVEVAPYAIWFDGTEDDGTHVWSSIDTAPTVAGDLDYDEAQTVKDIVRFKWYLKNGIAENFKAVTDLTKDNIVDDLDIQELRSQIVKKN